MYVTPKKGHKIWDPHAKGYLPDTGRDVADDLYWHRLKMDGDVTVGEAPSEPDVAESPKPKLSKS